MTTKNQDGVFLRGSKIFLRDLRVDDFNQTMVGWHNDRDVTRFLVRGTYPVSVGQLQADFRSTVDRREDVQFALCELATGAMIGLCGLHGIQAVARLGEFRILIGEKAAWNKGFGTEALRLMVSYAFEILNLHKVWLGVNTGNLGAFNSYKRAGFVAEGELRDEVYRNGRYYNVARMSLLRDEYEKMKDQWEISAILKDQFRPSLS